MTVMYFVVRVTKTVHIFNSLLCLRQGEINWNFGTIEFLQMGGGGGGGDLVCAQTELKVQFVYSVRSDSQTR